MTGLAQLLTFLGSAACYVPLLLVVYWCLSPAFGGRLAVMLAVSGGVNEVVKMVAHAPRPYWTDPSLRTVEPISSFGMPSGHAQNAVVVWGRAAWEYRRAVGWVLAAGFALAVGLARYVLHVHSMEQILVGWALGLMLLAGFIALEKPLVAWWRGWTLKGQLLLSVALPLAIFGLIWASTWLAGDRPVPQSWVDAVLRAGGKPPAVSLANAAMLSGLLVGVLAGLSLMAERGGFSVAGSVARRAIRVPIGIAGLVVIGLLGSLPAESLPARFLELGLSGLWVTWGAPLLFLRMGLAKAGTQPVRHPVDHHA